MFDELPTEAWNAAAADLDLRDTAELVALMTTEDASVPAAVERASAAIVEAIDAVADRLARGGRLVYVGAGHLRQARSRRCRRVRVDVRRSAGARHRPRRRRCHERRHGAGARRGRRRRRRVRDRRRCRSARCDAVVGLSASGRTPYVRGALDVARSAGALTVALVAVPESELGRLADHEVAVVVGPEVIAGSTRLKAGTAQKLVLNMISTISMVRLGKTYGNLMVDVVATNDKLRARVHRIVAQATGADADRGRRRRSPPPAATRRSRSSPCSPASTPRRREQRLDAVERRRAEGARAMRLGVQACLVDGRLEPGDVEVEDGVVVGDRPRGREAAASRSRASSTCR